MKTSLLILALATSISLSAFAMKRVLFIFTVIAALAVPVFAGGLEDSAAALALYNGAKYSEAQVAFEKMLTNYPTDIMQCAVAQNTIGYCLSQQKKYPEAIAAFEKVISTYPTEVGRGGDAQRSIGNCFYSQRKFPEAQAAFEKVLSTYPAEVVRCVDARIQLFGIHFSKNNTVQAANVVLLAGYNQATTQALRVLLNRAAVKLNKMENAKNGKSISDASQFTKVNALIVAENTGVGFKAVVESLGLTLPANYDTELTRTIKERDDFLAGMGDVPTPEFLGRLEFYLGVDQTRAFGVAYNK